MRAVLALGTVAVVAMLDCGSTTSSSSALQTTNEANPCASRGATYLFRSVEQNGGTCGPVADQIVNVNADGTVAGPGVSCESITQTGCTARDTGCISYGANGSMCTATTSVTFTSDGASARGLITENCSASATSCTSTYAVTASRQ